MQRHALFCIIDLEYLMNPRLRCTTVRSTFVWHSFIFKVCYTNVAHINWTNSSNGCSFLHSNWKFIYSTSIGFAWLHVSHFHHNHFRRAVGWRKNQHKDSRAGLGFWLERGNFSDKMSREKNVDVIRANIFGILFSPWRFFSRLFYGYCYRFLKNVHFVSQTHTHAVHIGRIFNPHA